MKKFKEILETKKVFKGRDFKDLEPARKELKSVLKRLEKMKSQSDALKLDNEIEAAIEFVKDAQRATSNLTQL